MKALHRKLLRDLWWMKSQAIAIGLVIACGVATFVMSVSTASSLFVARDTFYRAGRFADVFLHLKRAPDAFKKRLEEIPGVSRVATRVLTEVKLVLPGVTESVQARLISLSSSPQHDLNALYLRRGDWPHTGKQDEVLVSEAFAQAHDFVPGDAFDAILNGRLKRLRITGIGLSPEYIYPIRPGEVVPDERRYGILWMDREAIASALDMKGAFNDACLTFQSGTNVQEVLRRVDLLTAPYGGQGAIGRGDQISNRFLTDELSQLRVMALIPPTIFLLVSAFVLNMVMARLVNTQREQIATLKAFGYSNREVSAHYRAFAAAVTVGGIAMGSVVGTWMGRGLTGMYIRFFRFPVFEHTVSIWVYGGAAAFALTMAFLGVRSAIRRAAKLPPAEAMRPEAPPRFRSLVLDRLFIGRWISAPARMVLRRLHRQPLKAALAVGGLALATAVLILGSFSSDIVHYVINFQFQRSLRQDAMITFTEPPDTREANSLRGTSGVRRVEAFRTVPARLRSRHYSVLTSVTGIQRDRELFRVLNLEGTPVSLPAGQGLTISDTMARSLKVKPGDILQLEVLEGARPTVDVRVAALLRDFSGTAAYMEFEALNRMMKDPPLMSGAFLSVDEATPVYAALDEMPRVAGTAVKAATLSGFQNTISENLLRMRIFNFGFATIIAFGVVYNAARIALSERARELATLRVLGFTRTEVSWMLLGEIAILTLIALPAGLLVGHLLCAVVVQALATRTQRFPFIIEPPTYGMAVLIVMAASIVSALIVRRRIDRLNLVEVLKSRE